jgi:hypothetical protein
MILFNSTLDIGGLISSTTNNVTGSVTMTLLLIVVLLLLIALLFREPIVLFGLLIVPIVIVFASYESQNGGTLFYTLLGILGVIFGWQFAKIIMGWGR